MMNHNPFNMNDQMPERSGAKLCKLFFRKNILI